MNSSNQTSINQSINPIFQIGVQEYVVYGQESLQRQPTALDRVGIRRACFYVEKTIRQEANRRQGQLLADFVQWLHEQAADWTQRGLMQNIDVQLNCDTIKLIMTPKAGNPGPITITLLNAINGDRVNGFRMADCD